MSIRAASANSIISATSNIIVYSNAKGACMQITDDMTSVV